MSTPIETKPLEWQALWDAMDAKPLDWIETTEEMYGDMLDCLPPRAWRGAAFLVGEPLRHNSEGKSVHACFRQVGQKFYAKNMTVDEFGEVV